MDIAVIGLSARFPGAGNATQYWNNLQAGVESIHFFSDADLLAAGVDADLVRDPRYVKAAPVLHGVGEFDAAFFGYAPREARVIDPQQRLFLECAWEALENSGYDGASYQGSIGVFAGAALNTYLLFAGLLPAFRRDYVMTLIGNDKDFLATRVSYKLNLRGPSVSVQTACSTSLVAVHLACQSLLNGECDMAMAGGVSVRVPQTAGYLYEEGGIFSPDGHCRAFDAGARGTVFGSGAGCVVLKRLDQALADGDTAHAVIKGSAVNNDGSSKVDFTAPSVTGQSRAVAEALAHAEVDPETISYLEAHGTGTPLGDPIEIAALTKGFRAFTPRRQFCGIGSVKTNIGHMDAAAGVAGLIKTILALQHRLLPPSLHFRSPNPHIDFEESPFFVNTTASAWEAVPVPRRAAINSLGMGGTNAFVILEEAPRGDATGPSRKARTSRTKEILVVSAKTTAALETATRALATHLRDTPDAALADVAFTLQVGRRHWPCRRLALCRDRDEAIAALANGHFTTVGQAPTTRQVIFMFSGQGAQHVDMGRRLYESEAVFRDDVDHSAEILRPWLGLDLRALLYPPERGRAEASERLDETRFAQPALFVIEHALACLWQSWGVRPDAMIGHSLGEYVAACIAGVFSLPEALGLVAERGRLMQAVPGGAMLAVPLASPQVLPLLGERLCVAAINGPSLCTVAGETRAIQELEERLSRQGVAGRRLRTSHAFHSAMMDPVLAPLTERVRAVARHAPRIPFVSNVTGTWIAPEQAMAPEYWAQHARQPVRFAEGIREILRQPGRALLEIGPGRTLSALANLHGAGAGDHVVVTSMDGPNGTPADESPMVSALSRLWMAGVDLDWWSFHAGQVRHHVPLPTYPFERSRFWYDDEAPVASAQAHNRPAASAPQDDDGDAPSTPTEISVAAVYRDVLGLARIGRADDFFALGGNSLLMAQAVARLNGTFATELSLLDMLGAPTVARLAGCIETLMALSKRR